MPPSVVSVGTAVGTDLPMMTGTESTATLVDAKIRAFTPMIIIYMVGYIGLTVLAGFAKGFLALKVAGYLNMGFLLIACNYALSLVVALAYVRFANITLDPMVQKVVSAFGEGGGPR
jgi:uncharacterized membrane protein (DUF485 family)